MKIKRFNESIETNDLRIIKEYFSSFIDDLDDICTITFNKVNDNLFIVYILLLNEDKTYSISDETMIIDKIDNWIKINDIDEKLLIELKSSMKALIGDEILEEFKLNKNPKEFTPVEDYLRKQFRFRHLDDDDIQKITDIRDAHWKKMCSSWKG